MAAEHLQDHIKTALIRHVAAMVLNPVIPVAYWDQAFTKPLNGTKPLPFIEAKIFTSASQDISLGADDESLHSGFLQLNLNWPQVAGETAPAKAVGQIVNWCRRGKQLVSGPVVVHLHRAPKEATPFLLAPYTVTQITVPYQVFSKQF
jgi:hypothetical protein